MNRLSLREAAELLGVSDETLRLWCQGDKPRIDHYRVGKLYRFDRPVVEAYLEQSRVTAAVKRPVVIGRRKLAHI